jgi:hypothetical protein
MTVGVKLFSDAAIKLIFWQWIFTAWNNFSFKTNQLN